MFIRFMIHIILKMAILDWLQGVPVLEYVAGCEYIFEWDTNVVCERNETDVSQGKCVYEDPVTRAIYNFTGLQREQPIQVQSFM